MKTPTVPRQRLVLGTRATYEMYLRNFLYTPKTARRLDRADLLYGMRPSQTLVILLPGWRDEAIGIPRLFSAVCDWKVRWRDIGTEEIPESELIQGLPARKANLLNKYQSLIDGSGTNYLAIESAKEWIRRLDERDVALLSKALNLQENEDEASPKK